MVNQAPPVTRIPAYRGSCHIRLHQPEEALVALEETLEPLELFNVDACCRRRGEIKLHTIYSFVLSSGGQCHQHLPFSLGLFPLFRTRDAREESQSARRSLAQE